MSCHRNWNSRESCANLAVSPCVCVCVCVCVKKSPLIYMLAVAMATRLNNFRSSRFKTTILPADSLSLCMSCQPRSPFTAAANRASTLKRSHIRDGDGKTLQRDSDLFIYSSTKCSSDFGCNTAASTGRLKMKKKLRVK